MKKIAGRGIQDHKSKHDNTFMMAFTCWFLIADSFLVKIKSLCVIFPSPYKCPPLPSGAISAPWFTFFLSGGMRTWGKKGLSYYISKITTHLQHLPANISEDFRCHRHQGIGKVCNLTLLPRRTAVPSLHPPSLRQELHITPPFGDKHSALGKGGGQVRPRVLSFSENPAQSVGRRGR